MTISNPPLVESSFFKSMPKEVWVGWVSSLVEAYNMAIYCFVAPSLAKLLFQQATEWSAVFFSYSLIFIGSCLLYPAGALYYGFIGDKLGRQKTCVYSTLGLAIATGLMGLVPFHFLSNNAWVCFLVLICGQYFFSGGEYHGSIVFSLEHAGKKRGGLMSALSCLFAVFGLVAANGLATLARSMEGELWIRLCFLAGGLGGLISYLLKNHCKETPAFTSMPKPSRRADGFIFHKSEWQKIGVVVAVLAFFIVSYTFIFLFLPLLNFDQSTSQTFDTFKALMAYGLLLVAAGIIADRIGIEKVMLVGVGLFSIATVPLLYLCENLLVLQLVLTAFACLAIGPIHSFMLHQFQVQNRCRAIFMSSAIATSVFGGSTVPICMMIFDRTHSLVMCGLYPLTVALVAFGSLIFNKKTVEVLL